MVPSTFEYHLQRRPRDSVVSGNRNGGSFQVVVEVRVVMKLHRHPGAQCRYQPTVGRAHQRSFTTAQIIRFSVMRLGSAPCLRAVDSGPRASAVVRPAYVLVDVPVRRRAFDGLSGLRDSDGIPLRIAIDQRIAFKAQGQAVWRRWHSDPLVPRAAVVVTEKPELPGCVS